MSDPKQPTDQPPAASQKKAVEEKTDDKKPQKASGLDYVFKIAPADPKNNFDFEDVADK